MDILLTTLNSSYSHCSFGLRYLLANLAELRERAEILEFTIKQRPLDIVEAILARKPRIVGIGVYIWNARESLEIVSLLKKLQPELCVVLGGPEVSFETEGQRIIEIADHTITGEADLAFAEFCRQFFAGNLPQSKVSAAELPNFTQLFLPYAEYTDEDIQNRVVYIEASRGCPFTCEFCLSSLDIPVRAVPLERILPQLKLLIDRGLRQFKFVDRTFNLNINISKALVQFFLDHWQEGMFLHFEMIPDRLPEALRELIQQFPPGALQFEVGIQTFDALASENISRRNNHTRTADNFSFIRDHTGIHIHADLIVGLPGEDTASFGRGFDRLLAMRPQEIQVGILKRLKGTPITRHDEPYQMRYSDAPPYEILSTKDIPFTEMQVMRRFAKYWDLIGNSGNFPRALSLLWRDSTSPYTSFRALTEYLYARLQAADGINLMRLLEALFHYLTDELQVAKSEAAETLWLDFSASRPLVAPPQWLKTHFPEAGRRVEDQKAATALPKRQQRHRVEL
jgi:radical SAM superfamily enzyme YgiQ (UPF0313 family)